MEKNAMNIYQKLIEVRKSCPFLKKDNEGFQYKYVSSSQTLGALREAMDKQGLLLIPEIIEHSIRDFETSKTNKQTGEVKTNTNFFTDLTMIYTWLNCDNPDEKIICHWCSQGEDTGEKGVGKALTYGEKYFLLKFFNIPTDKDDPDSNQKTEERIIKPKQQTKPPEKHIETHSQEPASLKQDSAIHAISRTKYNVQREGVYPLVSRIIGIKKPIKSTTELTKEQASIVIKMLQEDESIIHQFIGELQNEEDEKIKKGE